MTEVARLARGLVLLTLVAVPALAQEQRSYQGMRLEDALRDLQARGLPVIFSSAIVRPDLRVGAEPRARMGKQQLEELLAPHGLAVREGPGGTLQIVHAARKPDPPRRPGTGAVVEAVDAAPAPHRHEEFVRVTDVASPPSDRGAAAGWRLDHADLVRQSSVMEDPLRAVHTLPGVMAVDDFRSDIAVRGSPFRHVDLVVDGVATHWLRHTTFGRGATGSLMMLSGLVVERAALQSGAYPRRHGDRLGSELALTLRQGSRTAFAFRGVVGGAHAVLAAEGPLGATGQSKVARGSWLVSGRQSLLEWPPEPTAPSRTPFGFSDSLVKVVYDVRPTQQFSLTAIRGVASVDEDEDHAAPPEPVNARTRASAITLAWKSTLSPAVVLRQQTSLVTQRTWGGDRQGQERDADVNQEVSYRADISRRLAGGALEGGGAIERIRAHKRFREPNAGVADRSAWLRSGFAHYSWLATSSLTLSPGLRVTWSSLAPAPVVSRWLLGEWALRHGWRLTGSVGAARQLPDLVAVIGEQAAPPLGPERARHLEFGVAQQRPGGVRWQATLFSRREADVIRAPDLHPRLVDNRLVVPAAANYHVNALQGHARGLELQVSRRTAHALSGWATYAYGRTRHRDASRNETFWADFDQRHTFSALAHYRFSEKMTAGATFRAGSSFPIAGYFASAGGRLMVGSTPNAVRLPAYARLDLRGERQVRTFGRSVTIFAEALNVLNRSNVGLAGGWVNEATGAAHGFTATMLRRRATAGVAFAF